VHCTVGGHSYKRGIGFFITHMKRLNGDLQSFVSGLTEDNGQLVTSMTDKPFNHNVDKG
jgi:hypothetical protein